uniref:SHSP domain-containing protein n=1 Tax=Ascaris lumbricoides TaxID=6252 RepID=A0A0M3HS17_ASCLU
MARRFPPFSPIGLPSRFFDDFRDLDLDRHFMRPYWTEQTLQNSQKFGEGSGDIIDNDESFSITIDVSHFAPDELKVNIDDGVLVIEGKHEIKNDRYGQIERRFVRRLQLPKNTKPETVTSELSKDGMLTVQTPKNIERRFVRRLQLPKNTKPETVTSELSKDGMLTVQTPKNVKEPPRSRNIPIFRKD